MGNIKSFCCKDTASNIDDHEEQTRILDDRTYYSCGDFYNDGNSTNSPSSQQDTISYGSTENGNNKTLEQSALDKIYQKMASNVIDVAPGESMVMQQAEFLERQRVYQSKLSQIKVPLPLKSANRVPHSTQHLNDGQEKRRIEYEPISNEDVQLINEISLKSVQAMRSFQIDSKEEVVAQFKP